MRVVRATFGALLLLVGQYCALNSLRIVVMGPPSRSYGIANPWPFLAMASCGLGVSILGALLLMRPWSDDRRQPDRR
jgi:hypothetical protein